MADRTPHDSLFRHVFGQVPIAREHLRGLVPAALAAKVDWSRLVRAAESSVDDRFRELRSDLVFRVATRDGHPLVLYLLFEHQRRSDPYMSLRVLGYVHRLWQGSLGRDGSAGRPLPRIFPIVLYNGERPWSAPTSLRALHGEDGLQEVFGDYQARLTFLLQDLSQTPDEALTGSALRVLTLLVLKHASSDGFWERFLLWTTLIHEILRGSGGLSAVEAVLRYGLEVGGVPAAKVERRLLAQLPLGAREVVVTWADHLREQGREQERDEARKVQRELLLLDLERLGEVTDAIRARIEAADTEQLTQWHRHLIANQSVTFLAEPE